MTVSPAAELLSRCSELVDRRSKRPEPPSGPAAPVVPLHDAVTSGPRCPGGATERPRWCRSTMLTAWQAVTMDGRDLPP